MLSSGKRNKTITWTQWTLVLLVAIGAFLRLYNLQNSLHFQGDQGRDAMIVARIFAKKDLVFIGPVTSVGNMYLGPMYYYFMLPFLWLTYPNPAGPAFGVAILGIITVWLMYKLGKELIGEKAALIATAFYTFSSIIIQYTRFSWNPNPAPLVSLLMIYFTHRAWKKDPKYWIGVAITFTALLQLHYLTLLSLGGAGLVWLISFFEKRKTKKWSIKVKKQVFATLIGALFLLLSFTPLALFDYKHDWLNVKAFSKLISQEQNFKISNNSNLPQKIIKTALETHGRGMHILLEITIGQQRVLNSILLLLILGGLGWMLIKDKKDKHFSGRLVITLYLLTGILGTSLYEHTIFDHYISYLFPVTFWIYGILLDKISQKHQVIGKTITIGCLGYFLWLNLPKIPLASAGWTVKDMQRVSESIYQRVDEDEKYNLVLLSESRDIDGQSYRYFLTATDKPPVLTEKRGEISKLFIINEELAQEKVTDSPIYEIVVFPNKTPSEVYSIPDGPEITVLTTSK